MGKKEYIGQEYAVAKGGSNLREGTRQGRALALFTTTFFSMSIIISVCLIAFTIVFFFSAVEGSSMMNVLNPGWTVVAGQAIRSDTDSVIVNRYARPSHGDIIVVRYYHAQGDNQGSSGRFDLYIKRMIAFNGQHVWLEQRPRDFVQPGGHPYRYVFFVDGVEIDESYLDPHWGQNVTYFELWFAMQSFEVRQSFHRVDGNPPLRPVPPTGSQNHPAVAPPLQLQGWHARFIEEVRRYDEDGNHFYRYEIYVPRGYMFYMGDNRGGDGSADDRRLRSRDSATFGPQPMSTMVGVVADIIRDNQGLAGWVWGRAVHFITFRWLWG